MQKQFLKDSLGWGFLLWLIGWILGIILFKMVSPSLIGWIIMPIGIIIALLVLFKKVKGDSFQYYLKIAVIWTLLAVVLDYIFNVQLFQIVGYYKFDIYLYYALTFILPLVAGVIRKKK
ncbi:MAG: hypothetical protein PHU42_02850 [Patescibacteria group bacterium]|nr:hypothetical protein [Patescibacteria group bacterium]